MKATKEIIASIPASASVFYSNRVNASESYSTTWGESSVDREFSEQFIGASMSSCIDSGDFDGVDLRSSASGKTVYSIVIEEGEYTDREGTCAAERLEVKWSA